MPVTIANAPIAAQLRHAPWRARQLVKKAVAIIHPAVVPALKKNAARRNRSLH